MTTSVRILLCTALILFSVCCHAQDIRTESLRWTSNATIMLRTSEQVTHQSYFVTSANEVVWYQKNGAKVKHFSINEVIGSWSSVGETGSIKFKVSEGQVNGEITFARDPSGERTVTLDFSGENTYGIKQRFIVASVNQEG